MRNNVPMKNKSKHLTLNEWVKVVGEQQALKRLWDAGLAVSTAEKIATGRYENNKFRRKSLAAIQKALASDGFELAGTNSKAS